MLFISNIKPSVETIQFILPWSKKYGLLLIIKSKQGQRKEKTPGSQLPYLLQCKMNLNVYDPPTIIRFCTQKFYKFL